MGNVYDSDLFHILTSWFFCSWHSKPILPPFLTFGGLWGGHWCYERSLGNTEMGSIPWCVYTGLQKRGRLLSHMSDVLTKKRNLNTDTGRQKETPCGHEDGHPSTNERGLGLSLASQLQEESLMPTLLGVAKLQSCETIRLCFKSLSPCLFSIAHLKQDMRTRRATKDSGKCNIKSEFATMATLHL